MGASLRLLVTLVWSAGSLKLTALCIAPDHLDCTVYNAASGHQLATLHLPAGERADPCQLSPNGQLLVYHSQGELTVYNLASQTSHGWGHQVYLRALFSPDSLKIAYTRILEKNEQGDCLITNCIHTLGGIPKPGYGALGIWEPDTWSKDGRYLACAVFSKHSEMDLAYRQLAFPFMVFDVCSNSTALELSNVYCKPGVVFSPDSQSLLTASSACGTWDIWDIASGSITCSFPWQQGFRSPASWSPDSAYIASVQTPDDEPMTLDALFAPSHLHIHDAASGSRVSDFTCEALGVQDVVWHPAQSSIFLQHEMGITGIGFAPSIQAVAESMQRLEL